MGIIVSQFGFANGSGALADIVDGDDLTGWSPVATDFAAYPDLFFASDRVTLNYGKSFPAIQFDMGDAIRIQQFLLRTETILTLGPTVLIGSDVTATSPADTLRAGDLLLAQYNAAQINSNKFLIVDAMKNDNIRKRFFRFLQRSTNAAAPPDPGHGPVNSVTFDSGVGTWITVPYASQLIIETWGGGASGGAGSTANNGGTTTAGRDVSWVQTSLGGSKAASVGVGGLGGTSSGANTDNITGGNGSPPVPNSTAPGNSGKGGDSPNGGTGGAAIFQVFDLGRNFFIGNPGNAPGGGGGGRSMWYPAGDVAFAKNPGGGAGGYSRHVVARGSGAAEPGDGIGWSVGNGGIGSNNDGAGAQGRVRFSWT